MRQRQSRLRPGARAVSAALESGGLKAGAAGRKQRTHARHALQVQPSADSEEDGSHDTQAGAAQSDMRQPPQRRRAAARDAPPAAVRRPARGSMRGAARRSPVAQAPAQAEPGCPPARPWRRPRCEEAYCRQVVRPRHHVQRPCVGAKRVSRAAQSDATKRGGTQGGGGGAPMASPKPTSCPMLACCRPARRGSIARTAAERGRRALNGTSDA